MTPRPTVFARFFPAEGRALWASFCKERMQAWDGDDRRLPCLGMVGMLLTSFVVLFNTDLLPWFWAILGTSVLVTLVWLAFVLRVTRWWTLLRSTTAQAERARKDLTLAAGLAFQPHLHKAISLDATGGAQLSALINNLWWMRPDFLWIESDLHKERFLFHQNTPSRRAFARDLRHHMGRKRLAQACACTVALSRGFLTVHIPPLSPHAKLALAREAAQRAPHAPSSPPSVV